MRPWAGSGESELAFKQARIRACYDLHLAYRCARLLKWALLLAALGCGGLTLLGFALAIVSVAVAWCMISIPIRVLYPLEMALDVVQALLACSLFHASYSIAGGTGALRCWTCLLAGNGVMALVALTKTSPLTFKWQLPALVAIGGTLLALAPGWTASSPLLQHGFSLLITLARILLPILAPAFFDLSPPEGFSALLAPAPDTSQLSEAEAAARAAACAAAQAATVLLGCCSLALSQHRAEQRQRKQFALAAYAAQQQQQQQQ